MSCDVMVERLEHLLRSANMSSITTSGLKTSVCAALAVTMTALIAWGFESDTAYLQQRANEAVTMAQVDSSTPASDRDARIG